MRKNVFPLLYFVQSHFSIIDLTHVQKISLDKNVSRIFQEINCGKLSEIIISNDLINIAIELLLNSLESNYKNRKQTNDII